MFKLMAIGVGALLVLITGCGSAIEAPASQGTVLPAAGTDTPISGESASISKDVTAPALPTQLPMEAVATAFAALPYHGPPIPTPQALDRFSLARPAWLVVGDQLYRGTRGTSGTSDVLPSPAFLKTITKVPFPVFTQPAVILSTTPVERLSASVERWGETMQHQTLRTYPDPVHAHIVLLEPISQVENTVLTVYMRFGPGQDVTYHWRLNPVDG